MDLTDDERIVFLLSLENVNTTIDDEDDDERASLALLTQELKCQPDVLTAALLPKFRPATIAALNLFSALLEMMNRDTPDPEVPQPEMLIADKLVERLR
jgi:hypothetical protein